MEKQAAEMKSSLPPAQQEDAGTLLPTKLTRSKTATTQAPASAKKNQARLPLPPPERKPSSLLANQGLAAKTIASCPPPPSPLLPIHQLELNPSPVSSFCVGLQPPMTPYALAPHPVPAQSVPSLSLISEADFSLPPASAEEPNDYEICKNLIRAVVNMRLDLQQAKKMVNLMKELRKRPLQTEPAQNRERKVKKQKKIGRLKVKRSANLAKLKIIEEEARKCPLSVKTRRKAQLGEERPSQSPAQGEAPSIPAQMEQQEQESEISVIE